MATTKVQKKTTTSKADAAIALGKQIQKFGIPVDPYKKGPSGADVAILTLSAKRDKLRIWPGTAEVTVYGDSKNKQVVINVNEKPRAITRKVEISYASPSNMKMTKSDKNIEYRLQREFPIRMPADTKYKVTDIKVGEYTPATFTGGYGRQKFTGTVTARTKSSRMSFLVGMDESHLFISRLPAREVKSVAEAHRLLRPKDISRNAIRQGEWFFEPAPTVIQDALDASMARDPYSAVSSYGSVDSSYSNHRSTTVKHHKGRRYVIGWIVDTEKRHAPLFLSEWCRPIRNRELDPPTSMRDGTSWD